MKGSNTYKLTVKEELEKKIRFLCDQLPKNEWSGTLFYKVEGSFKEDNLHIICVDFFLQDVGEATYTEFKNDVELAGYIAAHELWDYCMGLIHSHNNFGTFFSGTDLATLKEEGKDTNHFVSLIVNNAGVYTAAITKKLKCTIKGENYFTYESFNGAHIEEGSSPMEEERTYIEYYPLEITVEKVPIIPKSELELRLEEVRRSTKSYINRPSNFSNFSTNNYIPTTPSTEEPAKKEKYVQQSLFSDEEFDNIEYDKVHFNPEVVDSTIKQLITGDIFAGLKSNIDLNRWVASMEALYDKRFTNDENLSAFRYWADCLVDFLEEGVKDEKLIDKGQEYMDALWAYDVISKLEEYPENKYLKIIIKSLERWLI